jgi:hypothetical protein
VKIHKILVSANEKVMIDGIVFVADTKGLIECACKEREVKQGFPDFERAILDLPEMDEEKKDQLYGLFIQCGRRMGLKQMAEILQISRTTMGSILNIGIGCGIISKIDSQWKLSDYSSMASILKETLSIKERSKLHSEHGNIVDIDNNDRFVAAQREGIRTISNSGRVTANKSNHVRPTSSKPNTVLKRKMK